MREWFLASVLVATLTASAAAETIPAGQAASHVGQRVTVEGNATSVYTSRGGTMFIDVDGRYPNQAFVAVVFKSDTAAVGDLSSLQGKKVDITGTVKLYNGKPEIVVSARSQISP